MPQPLHQQQVVYPVQDSRSGPQYWPHVPNSAVPYIVSPVAFPQVNLETQQASSVASSTVSTPVVSCFSSPGYVSYGYINTPILSSASCTADPVIYDIPRSTTSTGSGRKQYTGFWISSEDLLQYQFGLSVISSRNTCNRG